MKNSMFIVHFIKDDIYASFTKEGDAWDFMRLHYTPGEPMCIYEIKPGGRVKLPSEQTVTYEELIS